MHTLVYLSFIEIGGLVVAKTSGSKRKTNTKAKSARNTKVKSSVQLQGGEDLRDEILTIVVIVLNLILLICNIGWVGGIGKILKEVQVGLFGLTGYFFPIVMLYICCLLLIKGGNIDSKIKSIAVFIIMLCISAIIHLFLGEHFSSMESFRLYYLSQDNGGLIGGALAELFRSFLGIVITFVLFVLFIVIAVVIVSEISVVSLVKKGGFNIFTKTKEGIARHKLKKQQARELEDEYGEDYIEEEYEHVNPRRSISIMDLSSTPLSDTDEGLLDKEVTEYTEYDTEEAVPIVQDGEIYTSGINEINKSSRRRRAERAKPEDMPSIKQGKPSRADVFTGKITKSEDISEMIEPRPQELEDDILNKLNDILNDTAETPASTLIIEEEVVSDNKELQHDATYISEDTSIDTIDSDINLIDIEVDEDIINQIEEVDYEEDEDDTTYIDTLESMDDSQIIHTASGKIIEKDTEALSKKTVSVVSTDNKPANNNNHNITKAVPKVEQVKKEYVYPPTSLLKLPDKASSSLSDDEFKSTAIKLQQTLHNFGIQVQVSNISCGPTVTRYEILPEPGVKVSKIVNLIDDIKLSLAASDIRIEAPIPGKSAVGIEVPNKENTIVSLRELFESEEFKNNKALINFALGKDIAGKPIVSDIASMPHMLIAGATGAGKSVCINTLIMSILYKYSPDEVRLIMVDPKVVELSVYNGIPHLLIPVVTDPKKASAALNWAVKEMTYRYNEFAKTGVRNLKGYNEKMSSIDPYFEKLPKIVIIIDELADLMMVAQNEVEDAICRLAQLARACGIHLIIATQRPSVNVITGLIKANIPSRIAFAVSSGIDSRTILDQVGAEKLLGKGDMLFAPQSLPKPIRVQGAFVSDSEVQSVVDFLINQGLDFSFDEDAISNMQENSQESMQQTSSSEIDELFAQVGRFIIERDKASIGNLQRVFKIGFNRAARIMDQLYEAGVVGEEQGTKPRQVLMTLDEFNEYVRR